MGLRIRAGDGSGTATLLDVQNSDGATTHFAVRKDYLVQNNLPMFPCRAWVTFNTLRNTNGAIDTSTTNRQIFGSGNVTSVSRGLSAANGAANLRFRVTFTEPMPNANYAVIGTATQYLNSNSTGSLVCLHTTANGTAGSGQGPGEGAPSNKTASSFDIIIVATATATTSGYDNHYVSLVVFG
jgi:hypothetical protein